MSKTFTYVLIVIACYILVIATKGTGEKKVIDKLEDNEEVNTSSYAKTNKYDVGTGNNVITKDRNDRKYTG